MKITLLCNAGLAIEAGGEILLVDLPNDSVEPFYMLPEQIWQEICSGTGKYQHICGFYFTHDHADHLDRGRLQQYRGRAPVFVPEDDTRHGRMEWGRFAIEYQNVPHAPIPQPPAHVVTLICTEGKSIYLAADAALNWKEHDDFLRGRRADIGIWNSMYLSRPETRALMERSAAKNYIYHMPLKPDEYGIWKKCERNFERYPDELKSVTVLDRYPSEIEI